jgi:hypothetical protein
MKKWREYQSVLDLVTFFFARKLKKLLMGYNLESRKPPRTLNTLYTQNTKRTKDAVKGHNINFFCKNRNLLFY